MTDKQVERVKSKISNYKKVLSLDKKEWGGHYRDKLGIRYLIPELYIKISDYKGALRYFNWFHKNFQDDSCYPIFLFEWTFVLFMRNKLEDAEKKLHLIFFSNTYLLNKLLEKESIDLGKYESPNWESKILTGHFHYNKNEEKFLDFKNWVSEKLPNFFFR